MNEEINEGDLVQAIKSYAGSRHFHAISKGQKFVVNKVYKCKCKQYLDIGIPAKTVLRAPYCGTCNTTMPRESMYGCDMFRKLPPPAKEIRIIEIASDLREQVRELVNDVLVKERRDV